MFEDGGQLGFEEGNAIQYTWSVPQDLAALGASWAGTPRAVAKLNTFFTQLNAGRYRPYDWAGNEPSLWTPWEYDYFGAPGAPRPSCERSPTTLYSDHPDDEPGNDDLGALSSWYVWAAIGLYPVTPGTADLALASPLFPDIELTLPDNRTLVLHAPGASAPPPYIQCAHDHRAPARSARIPLPRRCQGVGADPVRFRWDRPWLPASIFTTGGTLTYRLSRWPDPSWGAAPSDSPPSFAAGRLPAVGYSLPSGGTSLHVGQPATITLGITEIVGGDTSVRWSAGSVSGLTLSASSGVFAPGGGPSSSSRPTSSGSCPSPASQTQPLNVDATSTGDVHPRRAPGGRRRHRLSTGRARSHRVHLTTPLTLAVPDCGGPVSSRLWWSDQAEPTPTGVSPCRATRFIRRGPVNSRSA